MGGGGDRQPHLRPPQPRHGRPGPGLGLRLAAAALEVAERGDLAGALRHHGHLGPRSLLPGTIAWHRMLEAA